MDSRLVSLCQLVLLLVASSDSWRVKANHQFPTSRYSLSLNAKQVKEDLKLRRQHARRSQLVSLKPPPEGWPEPPMAAGDRLLDASSQQHRITSLSPLLAYQARLEQELLEQQKEDKPLAEPEIETHDESSADISLDDDFMKLLDPEELLKHNKQLKPFVSKGGQKPLEIVRSAGEQGPKNKRHGGISSLTALKAKSSKRKTRPAVAVAEGEGERVALRRGGNPKQTSVQKGNSKATRPSSNTNSRKIKIKETQIETPLKRRRKKKRTFAFANQPYFEDDVESTAGPDNSRHESGRITTTSTTISTETTTSTSTTTTTSPAITTDETKTIKSCIQETLATMKGSRQGTTQKYIEPKITTEQVSNTDRTTLLSGNKRSQISEKRKQVKKEMEKVLCVEQLEGSFSDKESDWKTSEANKMNILNVTPKYAIFSILRHKIIDIIDNIIRENPKSKTFSGRT